MNKLLIVISCVVLTSCASVPPQKATQIDSTTDASFYKSFSQMMDELSEKEKTNLHIAVLKISLEGIESAKDLVKTKGKRSLSAVDVKDKLHQLTYPEIIQLSNTIQSLSIMLPGQEPGLSKEFAASLSSSESSSPVTDLSETSWLITSNINGHISTKTVDLHTDGGLVIKGKPQENQGHHMWEQLDNKVRFSFNNDFAVYIGKVNSPESMKGKAQNVNGSNWVWEAVRLK